MLPLSRYPLPPLPMSDSPIVIFTSGGPEPWLQFYSDISVFPPPRPKNQPKGEGYSTAKVLQCRVFGVTESETTKAAVAVMKALQELVQKYSSPTK
jgi:hypothetical protein